MQLGGALKWQADRAVASLRATVVISLGKRTGRIPYVQIDYPTSISFSRGAAVALAFQVSTMQNGVDPVDYFARCAHRYISMHCQDWVMSSDGKAKEVLLGEGVVDWKEVFTAARKARIENYFVEREQYPADGAKCSLPEELAGLRD